MFVGMRELTNLDECLRYSLLLFEKIGIKDRFKLYTFSTFKNSAWVLGTCWNGRRRSFEAVSEADKVLVGNR